MCPLLALVALLLAPPPQGAENPVAFPELGLTLALPKLESLERLPPRPGNCRGEWTGKLESSELHLSFHALPMSEYPLFEPEDVVETWRNGMRHPKPKTSEAQELDFHFEPVRALAANAGSSPILACLRGTMQKKADPAAQGTLFIVGGLLAAHGWSLRVDAWPALSAAAANALMSSLEKCAVYTGALRDPRWTDEEAAALWKTLAPDASGKKLEKPVRTEHYLVLADTPNADAYVKRLEGCYAALKKTLPCEELAGRRLLPILYFRTQDEFLAYYRMHAEPAPKGDEEQHYAQDYWTASSLDSDEEHQNLMGLMKQYLVVRVRAWGGCRWLETGLRECVASKPKDRVETLRAVKKGKFTPLEKLLDDGAWDKRDPRREARGISDEADYGEQSALWMEFLRDGPWPKESFGRFVRAAGSLAEGDRSGVASALQAVYMPDLLALQKKWVEACAKK